MHKQRLALRSCAGLVAAAGLLGGAQAAPAVGATGGPAAANPPRSASPPAGAVVSRLRVVGVNRAVARAHGFVVRTRADGTEYAGRPGAGARAADNVEYGDCGSSWVFINPQGGHWSTINTGFALDHAAVSYHWKVNRTDPYGGTTKTWGGGLAFRDTWQGVWNIHGGGSGWETAGVTPSSSVLLWDGDVCTSLAPTDAEYVY